MRLVKKGSLMDLQSTTRNENSDSLVPRNLEEEEVKQDGARSARRSTLENVTGR